MKYFLIVILSLFLMSCDFFEEKKEMLEPIIGEDGAIDLEKIEELPSKIEEEISKKIEETKKEYLEEPILKEAEEEL